MYLIKSGEVEEWKGGRVIRTLSSGDYFGEKADMFRTFSAHADGKRRGLDRVRGWCWKGVGETRLWLPLDRHEPLGVRCRHARRFWKKDALGEKAALHIDSVRDSSVYASDYTERRLVFGNFRRVPTANTEG